MENLQLTCRYVSFEEMEKRRNEYEGKMNLGYNELLTRDKFVEVIASKSSDSYKNRMLTDMNPDPYKMIPTLCRTKY